MWVFASIQGLEPSMERGVNCNEIYNVERMCSGVHVFG